MKNRLAASLGAALIVVLGISSGAHAADKVKAIASFSIVGDMVRQVGGDRVDVVTLVGPDGDAHVFSPTPADAKTLASSQLFFVNGLGFEGWMERLEKSSGFTGKTIVASKGVKPHTMVEEEGHEHGAAEEDHDEHAKGEHHDEEEVTDPHAWQDLANGKLYVANIRDGLIAADPEGKAVYEANAAIYLDAIAKEETAVKQALGALPEARRRIITSHDAFGYFGAAYGLEIIAPEGVSTESEASAQDVAKIIRQIKAEHIPAVFLENITDHRLLDQIARETGAKIGGTLYSDALSGPDGPAPNYLDMFRHNVGTLTAALSS
jgi:zinc/manganese transport system substrate-binding protein